MAVTYNALQGYVESCTEFYGVTKSPASWKVPNAYFLVMEYANEGSAIQYFEKILKGTPDDWNNILVFIMDFASGLEDLHLHNVIHRYI